MELDKATATSPVDTGEPQHDTYKQTPASEQPLLERLIAVRSLLMSRPPPSSSSSTSSSSVHAESNATTNNLDAAWTDLIDVVKSLYALRTGSNSTDVARETESGMHIETEVDVVLDDVVPLFFQYWSQEGKVSEKMYPTYVHLVKIQHTLNQHIESGLFTNTTTTRLRHRLAQLHETIQSMISQCDKPADYMHQGEKMLWMKYAGCDETLIRMQRELDGISPALHPIHDRLVEIKEELEALLARKNPHAFSLAEVQMLQDELREIDSARIDGKYISKDGSIVGGQAAVIQLLEACFDDVHELLASRDAVGGQNPLRPVYEDLVRIKGKLERLLLVGHWTLRSGDLIPIQRKLGDIDNLRVDGKFMDNAGGVPQGQAVLHFLLHKCYRLVYKLQIACEPVADALMPIYNQLVTLQKCLNELKRWNVELSSRELVPYQMKLASIDAMRHDGKFLDTDGSVPEGQGILHDLLNKCYDLLRELQTGFKS